MSYYCPYWARNLRAEDITDEGDSVEHLYDTYGCGRFAGDMRVYFNSEAEDFDYGDLDHEECLDHPTADVRAETDPYDAAFHELITRYPYCTECADTNYATDNQIFPNSDALDDHIETEHNADIDNEEPDLITPPPAARIPADRVVIEVAAGRRWFTNVRLPDWVPPLIDDAIRAGRIQDIESVGRTARPGPRPFHGVIWNNQQRTVHVRGESPEWLHAMNRWADGYQFADLFASPPVATSHQRWPGATP